MVQQQLHGYVRARLSRVEAMVRGVVAVHAREFGEVAHSVDAGIDSSE